MSLIERNTYFYNASWSVWWEKISPKHPMLHSANLGMLLAEVNRQPWVQRDNLFTRSHMGLCQVFKPDPTKWEDGVPQNKGKDYEITTAEWTRIMRGRFGMAKDWNSVPELDVVIDVMCGTLKAQVLVKEVNDYLMHWVIVCEGRIPYLLPRHWDRQFWSWMMTLGYYPHKIVNNYRYLSNKRG